MVCERKSEAALNHDDLHCTVCPLTLPFHAASLCLTELLQDGKEYGDIVADRLVKLVRSQALDTRDSLHR